jgi:DNA mismatch repair ATPase MutS
VAAALSLLSLAALAWWAIDGNRVPFLFVAACLAVFGFTFRKRVQQVIASVDEPAHDLALLSAVLARIEREEFQSEALRELRRKLEVSGAPPSARIARLNRIMELIDSRDNVAVRAFGPLVLWTSQLAFAVEAWRKRTGHAVRDWLVAVGEIEALSSLSAYAFEHPADRYPEFVQGPPLYEAQGMAHPLLPENRAVRNHVRLAADAPLLVVSGSNMSGKSTLLRTVGANAVLAMAGAPVRADSLRLSPITIGASIRVMDSLQEGSSRFYAEIRRLRELIEIASGNVPLLFLLDELLHGTNSHDRRIGGAAVVRGLVARGAIGLITTHDLALAEIAESVQPPGANVHFEDHLENGAVSFDYQLRQGVVQKSNALELMRSIGLDV